MRTSELESALASTMEDSLLVVVEALFTYPVKSCAPMCVGSLVFSDEGLLAGDREWAVVDESSNVVWQGSHPKLALVQPELRAEHLTLRNDRGDHVNFETQDLRTRRDVQIWNEVAKRNDAFAAADAGDEVAAFLENTVGAGLRLVRLGQEALPPRRRESHTHGFPRIVRRARRRSPEECATSREPHAIPPKHCRRRPERAARALHRGTVH